MELINEIREKNELIKNKVSIYQFYFKKNISILFACHNDDMKDFHKFSIFEHFSEHKELEEIRAFRPIKEFNVNKNSVKEIIEFFEKEMGEIDYIFCESNLGFSAQSVWTIDPRRFKDVFFFDGSDLADTQHQDFFVDAEVVIEKIVRKASNL